MQDFLGQYYLWIKAFHVISIIAWMAALLYLPRLFVYHTSAKPGSELSETLKVMERRLLRFIMTPAMIASWVFGLLMLYVNPDLLSGQGWMHLKLTLVVLLSAFHGICAKHTRMFAGDQNQKSDIYFRVFNEIPTALMIIIVLLAVAKPF